MNRTIHGAALVALTLTALAAPRASAARIDLDFDLDAWGGTIEPGQFIDDEYAAWGVEIAGHGSNGLGAAITFDSANPTGNDSDLAAPGYHPTNTTPLGNLLILPKDVHDADRDGLVDDPDDHAGRPAGWFGFTFGRSFTQGAVALVDIEEAGGEVRLVNNLDLNSGSYDLVDVIAVPGRGDNSLQVIDFNNVGPFEAMMVTMAGSGAVDNVTVGSGTLIPEPASVALFGLAIGLACPRRPKRRA